MDVGNGKGVNLDTRGWRRRRVQLTDHRLSGRTTWRDTRGKSQGRVQLTDHLPSGRTTLRAPTKEGRALVLET